MLGRLGMTTDEAILQYSAMASALFSRRNRKAAYKDEAFKATTLEHSVKKLVSEKRLGERLCDDWSGGNTTAGGAGSSAQASGCRAFVCALPARNMAHPQRFRSYDVRANAGPNCAIWQAARATTAAPKFFKPIAIATAPGHAPTLYVDGALRVNNPVREVLDEARIVFGGTSRLGCLVSLGAGHSGVIGLAPAKDAFPKLLPARLVETLEKVVTDCEAEAQRVARQFVGGPADDNRYFRFSVMHGAGSVALDEWEHMDELMAHADAYLKDAEVSRAVDRLVSLLCAPGRAAEGGAAVTLNHICKSSSNGTKILFPKISFR
jgi:hypothetical protein